MQSVFTTKGHTYQLKAQTLDANAGSSMIALATGGLPGSKSDVGSGAPPRQLLSQFLVGIIGVALGAVVML